MRSKRRSGVVVMGIAFGIVLGMAACSSSSSTDGTSSGTTVTPVPTPTPTPPTQGTVGTAGGRVATPDGTLSVTIPAGALPADTNITIEEIPSPAAGGVGKAFEIGPTGTQFAVPVTLAFTYAEVDLQGADPASLEVATIASGEWVGLANGSVDTAAKIASAQTTHLSPYGLHAKTKGSTDAGTDATDDAAVADAQSDADADASGDAGPTDAGFDAAGCIHMVQQVGSCQNHPIQLCSASYTFTNCVNQMQGFTYDCCPGG